jgi:hypothetical protein
MIVVMSTRHVNLFLAACALALGSARIAAAQVPPAFGNAIAFQPEISVVDTGVLNDVQATVSADMKYVTLNMQVQQSNLLALREFTFEQTNVGFVGSPPAPAANVRDAKVHKSPKLPVLSGHAGAINPPVVVGAGAGLVLNQQGMTRLSPAK